MSRKMLVFALLMAALALSVVPNGAPVGAADAPTATAAATVTPTPTPITTVRAKDGMEMIYIPAGVFTMGDDKDSKPVHQVYVDSFWIDKTEVSINQYWACVNTAECSAAKITMNVDSTHGAAPVTGVSWKDANDYCEWVEARMPTEAEWEKAARGTDGRTWPWGNVWDVTKAGSSQTLEPAGSHPDGASPYGALDMAGGAWEWVSDWWEPDYYSHSPWGNPTGPEKGMYRVLRGGSRLEERGIEQGTTSTRIWYLPSYRGDYFGFRCAGPKKVVE